MFASEPTYRYQGGRYVHVHLEPVDLSAGRLNRALTLRERYGSVPSRVNVVVTGQVIASQLSQVFS